jgi:putative transposase
MKGKGSTDEQIAYALRQAESGYTDVCRQIGVSEASFYLWKKKKYAKFGLIEIRELRQRDT